MRNRLSILLILGAVAALPAMPQDADPPGRVARLGFMAGTVSFQPAGVEDWTPAEMNRPVTIGDHMWTEADGRAELETNNASMRIGARTNFTFVNLTDQVTQIQITTGTVNVRLHALAPEEGFEVDTPQFSFTLLRAGNYRIDVSEKGDQSIVTVRGGDGEINIGDKATRVPLNTQVVASGTDNPKLDAHGAPPTDQFDAWCMDRDRREDTAVSARYVSRDIPGYADLDQFGAWQVIPPYGGVWFPANMPGDWAPYRFGHFGWLDPWGWSWIDDAPWGYAPFHYGRWVVVNGAWGWVPGQIVLRPVFAPALVVFSDFPVGVVVADPVVGWFPLGFGEVYVPPFAVSVGFAASFNIGIAGGGAGFDAAHAHYMHRDGAMTAMRHGDFAGGHHVGRDYQHVPRGAMDRGHMGGRPGVGPNREARMGNHGAAHGVPPRGVADRHAMAHRPAPGANRGNMAGHGAPAHGGAPAAHGGGPAAHGGAPAAHGGAPARGGAPAAHGGAPAAHGGAPAARGGAPAARGGAPAARGGAPAARGGAPAARGGAPAARGGAPAARGGAPAARGGAPAARGGAPAARGGAPAARGGAPGGGSPAARGGAPGGGRPGGGTPGGGMGGRSGGGSPAARGGASAPHTSTPAPKHK